MWNWPWVINDRQSFWNCVPKDGGNDEGDESEIWAIPLLHIPVFFLSESEREGSEP